MLLLPTAAATPAQAVRDIIQLRVIEWTMEIMRSWIEALSRSFCRCGQARSFWVNQMFACKSGCSMSTPSSTIAITTLDFPPVDVPGGECFYIFAGGTP